MASRTCDSEAVRSRRPKDKDAAAKLARLMDNLGLSPEVLGALTGVSGKRIRQIVSPRSGAHANPHYGDVPERRLRHVLARHFGLLPADIWKQDARGLSPRDLDHLRELLAEERKSLRHVA